LQSELCLEKRRVIHIFFLNFETSFARRIPIFHQSAAIHTSIHKTPAPQKKMQISSEKEADARKWMLENAMLLLE
jgi:hypothetical protein